MQRQLVATREVATRDIDTNTLDQYFKRGRESKKLLRKIKFRKNE